MYKLIVKKVEKYDIYCLSDDKSNFLVEFILEKGATISDLILKNQDIYDGYANFDDLEALSWGRGLLLAPFPNRLKNGKYTFEGVDYQFPINDVDTGTAIHGFISQLKFNLGAVETHEDRASVCCHTSYEGQFNYYPFPFTSEVQYFIDNEKGFSMKFSVTNSGQSNMPIGLGWHPYFRTDGKVDDTILRLPKLRKIAIDENLIPTGEKTPFTDFEKSTKIGHSILDNCFKLEQNTESIKVVLKGEYGQLVYSQSTGIPYIQLFTPPHRKSIAVEPMTCNVDAFNNGDGLKILAPNETITLECKVNLELNK